jgi:uncharacterized protein (TIGR00730 family)
MMPSIRSVAVFCGSSHGRDPRHAEAARDMGHALGQAGLRLVYGGGRVGLMGVLADAALDAGGQVTGVIPDFLRKWEVAHDRVADLVVTPSMHTRKQRMVELADAFVTLPGGLGTFDETIEILTWKLLKLHAKPVVICDVAGSAGPLLALIEGAVEMGFARGEVRDLYAVARDVPGVMDYLATALPAAPAAADLT